MSKKNYTLPETLQSFVKDRKATVGASNKTKTRLDLGDGVSVEVGTELLPKGLKAGDTVVFGETWSVDSVAKAPAPNTPAAKGGRGSAPTKAERNACRFD